MRRIYRIDLYLDTEVSADTPDTPHHIARAVMAALPLALCDGVRLKAADATYRGKRVLTQAKKAAGRTGIASRRLLPG